MTAMLQIPLGVGKGQTLQTTVKHPRHEACSKELGMKKTLRRLELKRETLQTLVDKELRRVAGGGTCDSELNSGCTIVTAVLKPGFQPKA